MNQPRYEPQNPRPDWNGERFNAIAGTMDYQPSWGGITTAWRQPYGRDLAGVEVTFLGIPWDGTPVWRSGQRFMPRAIREASIYYGWRGVPFITGGEMKMCDYGDVLFHPGNMWDYFDQTEKAVAGILKSGASVFACGGDHSIPLPIVRAYGKAFRGGLSIIHFDAHSDAYAEIYPYPTGGTWVNELAQEGWVDSKRSVTLGVRPTREFGRADIFHQLGSETILDKGAEWAAEKTCEIVGNNLVYLTFDPDFLDASQAPAVHTPEPLGPDMRFVLKFFRSLMGKGLKLIGFDINEVVPQYEPPAGLTTMNTCLVANWCLELLQEGRKCAGLKK